MDDLPFFYYLARCSACWAFLAQWLAWRLRLPAILLLLGFGMILGLFVRPDEMLAELTGSDPIGRAQDALSDRLAGGGGHPV